MSQRNNRHEDNGNSGHLPIGGCSSPRQGRVVSRPPRNTTGARPALPRDTAECRDYVRRAALTRLRTAMDYLTDDEVWAIYEGRAELRIYASAQHGGIVCSIADI